MPDPLLHPPAGLSITPHPRGRVEIRHAGSGRLLATVEAAGDLFWVLHALRELAGWDRDIEAIEADADAAAVVERLREALARPVESVRGAA